MFRLQLKLAFQYLWGRKLRSFLTTLAIVFGTLVIFAMNTMLPTMFQAFQTNLLASTGQVDVTISHTSGEAFSDKLLNRIRRVDGIRAIAGSLSRTINIPTGYYDDPQIAALTLSGIDPREAQALRNYPIKEGRFLRASDEAEAVISTSLAESLDLKLGDKLHMPTPEGDLSLKVIGLLPSRSVPGNEEILITLYEAQKLFDLSRRINTIEINLNTTDQAERDAITKAIEAELDEDYVLGGLTAGSEMLASLQTGQMAFNLFGFLALFMGGFIIFNTFRTIVAERRHDIGMLRTIGASRGTILGLILVEGLVQGIVGTLIGMSLGYLLSLAITSAIGQTMSQFIHLQVGKPVIEPSLIVTTAGLGVGVTLLAGLLPALSASRLTPLEALRPSMAEIARRAITPGVMVGVVLLVLAVLGLLTRDISMTALGGLLFLIGLVLIAPALVRPIASVFSALIGVIFAREGTAEMAQGNLTRQPSRAAITASATMVGLAIVVGMGGLVWSLTGGFLGILERSLGSDYLIMPPAVAVWKGNVGSKDDLAERLRAVTGVEVVSTMRFAAASANGKSISLLAIDPEAYPQVASLTFMEGDSKVAFAQLAGERALIANGVFAAQSGLKVGDTVRLSTPTGAKQYRIAGIASDYLNAKVVTAYISHVNLKNDFRKSEDTFLQVNLAANADPAQVEPEIEGILEDYPQFKLVSGKDYFEENREIFNNSFTIMYVLLGVLVAPSLIALLNTLAIGVIERTREIGMLRAIGATRRQVRRIVIVEALLLAALGTALGLLAGLYLGYVMVLGLSAGGYPVEYTFPYAGLLAAIVIGLLFGILAAFIPARQAAHLQIIQALRYE